MNTLIRKSCLFFIAGILSFQFAFFSPQRAQAGSIDTVKAILVQIESLVPNSPFPISLGAFFALLDLVQKCTDTSDAGLMACLDGASADPTIGPMLSNAADKGDLELALKIYIDIKNADYVQLMIDGGKPIGCAAANIFTGVDICGLLEELAAIAGAVGEALEYAAGWLEELDVALFGQTPHMNQGMYYQERWRPYLKAYVEKTLFSSVNDDTVLTPHLNKAAFNNGGTYAEFGLPPLSVNAVYAKCVGYYNGFKDDNGPAFCDSNRLLFKNRANLFVAQAKSIIAFTTLLEPSIQNQNQAWIQKLENLKDDLDAKYPGMGVKDASKYPKWLWPDSIENYKKNVTKKIGKPIGKEFCLNGDYWECIDLPKADGMVYTFTWEAYNKFAESGYQGDAADILTASLEKVKPVLQNYFDTVKKQLETYWSEKKSSQVYGQVLDVSLPAKESLSKLQMTCKGLKQDNAGQKYSGYCLNSEPLKSCIVKIDKIWDSKPYDMSDSQLATYLNEQKKGIDACISSATKVVNEWARMDKLKQLYIDGWSKYYFDNFAAYHNTPETKDDQPKVQYELTFQLGNNFNACAIENMKQTEATVLAGAGPAMQQLLGQSAQQLMNNSAISKAGVNKILGTDKLGGNLNPPKIAEGFCATDGLLTADPTKAKVDGFGGGGVAPAQPPNDPSKRSHANNGKANEVKKKSGCTPYEWTDSNGKLQVDPYHMVCDTKEKYAICFEVMGGKIRSSYAQCTVPYGNSINSSYVDKPCCVKGYTDPLLEAQIKGASGVAKNDVSIDASNAADAGKKGLLAGVADDKKSATRDSSNKFRVKTETFVEKAGTVKVTPAISGSGGSVEPNTAQTIKIGERAKFKLKPNLGFKVKSVTGCGVTGDVKEEFETGAVVTDCTLQISFENKMNLINNGGRMQAPSPAPAPGAPTLDKRTLPTGRPLMNQPLQRKMMPLPPMPPVQEKQ
jgi:hypothetical protein